MAPNAMPDDSRPALAPLDGNARPSGVAAGRPGAGGF